MYGFWLLDDAEDRKDFGSAVKGVYGVFGGANEAPPVAWNGVCGTRGDAGAANAPEKMVCSTFSVGWYQELSHAPFARSAVQCRAAQYPPHLSKDLVCRTYANTPLDLRTVWICPAPIVSCPQSRKQAGCRNGGPNRTRELTVCGLFATAFHRRTHSCAPGLWRHGIRAGYILLRRDLGAWLGSLDS